MLRGSREFADIDAYETFLFGVMEKRNRGRQARGRRDGGDEAGHGHGLSDQQRAEGARSRSSLINVLRRTYSVPTSLIGKEVTVYIQEWYIDVYYAGA
ncbi:MAG: hypothetical protein R3A44_10350 [Caldilineaceae bacterium]